MNIAHRFRGFVTTALVLIVVSTGAAQYSGGTGEPNDPYQIATAVDLITLGETPEDYDKHFILTADIDLDPNLPGGRVFAGAVIPYCSAPAGADGQQRVPFTGVLDGNDHEICNLVIEAPCTRATSATAEYVGLIGQVGESGQVKRLGLGNVSINAGEYVGALAGENRGTILSCYASGRVTAFGAVGGLVGHNAGGTILSSRSAGYVEGNSVGGLVGLNWKGTVSSCHSTAAVVKYEHFGDIIGFDYAGGLVGKNVDGTISSSYSSGCVAGDTLTGGLVGSNCGMICSCYSSSHVTGESCTGGLVGSNESGILSCYSTGDVSGSYYVGGLVGEDRLGGIVTCYSTGRVTGEKYVGGLIGESFFTSVYFSYWAIEASGLEKGASGEGKTLQQMMSRGTFAGWGHGAQWVLEDGKDYPRLAWEGTSGQLITDPPHPYSGGTGEPNDPYFVRTADDLASVGRFPADWGACFELANDIDMASVDPNRLLPIGTNGFPFSGRFDGRGHTVRGFNGSAMQAGFTGVFGWIGASGTVRHLHLKDVVVSGGYIAGGLAGYNEGIVLACSTTGRVAARNRAGGIVGENRGTIISSCATCDVSEVGPAWVGGLVAANRGTISSCYAMGTAQGWCVGGLVGDNRDGTIITSYATTAVKRRGPVDTAGGLVSRIGFGLPMYEGHGIVIACFWDIQTSGWPDESPGTGLPTSEMQMPATFLAAGWDFTDETVNGTEDIWWIEEGKDYPRLWWEPKPPVRLPVIELDAASFDAGIAEGVVLVDFFAT